MIKKFINFFRFNLLWSHGRTIALVTAGVVGLSFLFLKPLFYLSLAFFGFSLYFFRNPKRVCTEAETDSRVIICPADGKVVDIKEDIHNGFDGYAYRISIFLSPLDVHVNWTPVAGVVERVDYRPGKFVVAFAPKSSEINERTDIVIVTDDMFRIKVRQIAGFIARRIVWWVKKGQGVDAGEKYGMIRFGSRVDIFLPANVDINVAIGQQVYAGQTVLGRRI